MYNEGGPSAFTFHLIDFVVVSNAPALIQIWANVVDVVPYFSQHYANVIFCLVIILTRWGGDSFACAKLDTCCERKARYAR